MEELNANFTIEQNEPLVADFEAFDEPPTVEIVNTDYEIMVNKPSINDVELVGNKTADELGLALVSDIPTLTSQLQNDSNYATQLDVMQAIAAIPQFKLSIVSELPSTGEKMTLYLVPKEGTDNDVYNEYIWIEQTSSFEFLGTTAVDLTDYVKKTDYAGNNKVGVISAQYGYAIGVTTTAGHLHCGVRSLEDYNGSLANAAFISKGTLNNVLTQYSKTVSITEDAYNALETKDTDTLYLIEE